MDDASPATANRIVSIQYLRAIAAIAVLLFHAVQRSGHGFAVGALGVDIFFVISGFVMWTITGQRPTTPGRFLLNRVRRIVPPYWIATMTILAGAFIGVFPKVEPTAGHVIGSLLFIPHISPSNGHVWPLLVQGWTLNLEMFFYLLFALLLPLPRTVRLAALCLLLAFAVAIGLLWPMHQPMAQTYTSPLLLEFAAGMALGEYWLRGRMPGRREAAALVLLGLASFAGIEFQVLPYGPAAAGAGATLLVLGCIALERDGAMPRIRIASYVGDASYSIYLWHTLGVSIALKLFGASTLPAFIAVPLTVAAGLLIGCVVYEALEKPLMRALNRRRGGQAASAATPAPV